MATPTIYKQRPHPEIVIHNRQPFEVLGWFDATHYTLTDGKRKFTALASECSEPKAPAAKEQKPETAGAPDDPEKPEDENTEDFDGQEETPPPPAGTKPGKLGKKAAK